MQRKMAEIIRDQKPLILSPDATIQDACRKMRDRRVGAVLVAGPKHNLLGIFTGRDVVCRVLADSLDPSTTVLDTVMTKKPETVAADVTAIEALRRMQNGGYRHLPIVDQGKVIGIVSRGDFRGLEQARLDEETGLWERI